MRSNADSETGRPPFGNVAFAFGRRRSGVVRAPRCLPGLWEFPSPPCSLEKRLGFFFFVCDQPRRLCLFGMEISPPFPQRLRRGICFFRFQDDIVSSANAVSSCTQMEEGE